MSIAATTLSAVVVAHITLVFRESDVILSLDVVSTSTQTALDQLHIVNILNVTLRKPRQESLSSFAGHVFSTA